MQNLKKNTPQVSKKSYTIEILVVLTINYVIDTSDLMYLIYFIRSF